MNNPKVKEFVSVTPIYTGGGIYVYLGELANGNYFMASDWSIGCVGDIRILDADPREAGDDCWYAEWQEPHFVRDLDGDECFQMWNSMIDFIIENKPEGNYSMSEIEERIVLD